MADLILRNEEAINDNNLLNKARIASRSESFKRQNAVPERDSFSLQESDSPRRSSVVSNFSENTWGSLEKFRTSDGIQGNKKEGVEIQSNNHDGSNYCVQTTNDENGPSHRCGRCQCVQALDATPNTKSGSKLQGANSLESNHEDNTLTREISELNSCSQEWNTQSNCLKNQPIGNRDPWKNTKAQSLTECDYERDMTRLLRQSSEHCNGPTLPGRQENANCRRLFSQMSHNLERSIGRFRSFEHRPSPEPWQRRPRLSSYTERPVTRTDPATLSYSCKILPSYQVLRATSEDTSCATPEDSTHCQTRRLQRRNSLVKRTHRPEAPESPKEEKPRIPDGGWGWVVVLSSLVISMVADGISFSFGLLYIEFLNHYGESKSRTSWIGSLFMAVPLLLGPVGSALVDRYGCRAMTMLGGVISGTGFILSSVSTTIEQQFLTFGIIAGSGLGLCYMTAVVSVAYWFDKKRSLATSLGACGTGIGTFVYAPMTTFFIEEYGWRGAILLLAGTFFNLCVCGAVMRDPEWWVLEQRKMARLSRRPSARRALPSPESRTRTSRAWRSCGGCSRAERTSVMTEMSTSTEKRVVEDPIAEERPDDSVTHAYCSVVNIPTFVKQQEKVPFEVLESLSNNKRVFNVILRNYPSLLMCRSISDHGELSQKSNGSRVPVTMSLKVKPRKIMSTEMSHSIDSTLKNGTIAERTPIETQKQPPLRSDSAGSSGPKLKRQANVREHTVHYLKDIKIHRNSLMHRGAMLSVNKCHLRASSCPNIYRTSVTTISKNTETGKCCGEWTDVFACLMDFSMFLELHFLLFSLATILLFTWFIVPYFYLSDFVINRGMSDAEASGLLSVIGVANTFGMIFLGWAGDQPWMNVTKTYAACLCACGISAGLMPLFMDNYWALFATSASFGIFFASNYSFTPTILVELIPLNRFTAAYGLILLCQGIGNLLGPPLAGFVFDVMNVWDYSFYLAGIWIIVSGMLMAFIPYTKNRLIWGKGTLEKDKQALFLD
ncbi:LOW QUALITY PROTEIN: uncharacterized protein [Bemisia tabaci]|uniref:LOW QUALITY PROTEIN: uncharacterized protein n=1 Tax=Bemisia tabaci TaxID=7038 RepID=UPI003B28884F